MGTQQIELTLGMADSILSAIEANLQIGVYSQEEQSNWKEVHRRITDKFPELNEIYKTLEALCGC